MRAIDVFHPGNRPSGSLSILLLSFLITLSAHSLSMAAHPWPVLRGTEAGTASIRYPGDMVLNEWHYTSKSNRRYKPGLAVWASPALAVVGGHPMAFIGGYDQTLHAMDLAEKRVIWKKITNGEIASPPAVGRVNGVDTVFWGSADRTVYAYAAFSGNRLWTTELVPSSSTLDTAHMSGPFLTEDRLYITCFAFDRSLPRNRQQGRLYCLDLLSGEVLWEIGISPGFLSSPVGHRMGDNRYIYVAARRGLLQCFDITGQGRPVKVWQYQMPHEVFGSPVIADIDPSATILFLGSKYGNIVAIDARTGEVMWQKMAGNWIDNTGCIGEIGGEKAVFFGSHDYQLYGFHAETGELLWKRALGAEAYSAPSFFEANGRSYVAASALDNHLYLLDGETGDIVTSFYTGNPIWDKLTKGENLWGSPAVVAAGENSVIVHGSFNGKAYVLPLFRACSLTAMAHSSSSLWWGLLTVFLLFCGVVLPIVLLLRPSKPTDKLSA